MRKSSKKTKTTLNSVFISTVDIEGKKYVVKTEFTPSKSNLIVSHVSFRGKVISSKETEYSETIRPPDRETRAQEVMLRYHQKTIKLLKNEKMMGLITPADYLEELEALLREKKKKDALALLDDALELYPDDPFLLSYYGCLEAIVNKNYDSGIEIAKNAFTSLNEKVPFGEEFFYPLLCLNLGRACIAAGRKKEAVEAFKKGLKIDSEDGEILWELKNMGMRKKTAIPLLRRSNPLNKYIGMILHRLSK